jgi:hypothetical protein
MTQASQHDLILQVPGQDESTRTWVVNPPQGRNSFRIVVRSRGSQRALTQTSRPWQSFLWAIANMLLSALHSWAGH